MYSVYKISCLRPDRSFKLNIQVFKLTQTFIQTYLAYCENHKTRNKTRKTTLTQYLSVQKNRLTSHNMSLKVVLLFQCVH